MAFKAETEQVFDINQLIGLTIKKTLSMLKVNIGHIALCDFGTGYLDIRSFHMSGKLGQYHQKFKRDDGITKRVIDKRKAIELNKKEIQSDKILNELYKKDVLNLLSIPIKSPGVHFGYIECR